MYFIIWFGKTKKRLLERQDCPDKGRTKYSKVQGEFSKSKNTILLAYQHFNKSF